MDSGLPAEPHHELCSQHPVGAPKLKANTIVMLGVIVVAYFGWKGERK